ncbi:MAG: hypothetical protein ACRD2U_08265 [Terriglobales bacterium]
MNLGSENRNKLIVAVVLMVIAIGLLARWLFSSIGTSSAASISPSATSVPAASTPTAHRGTRNNKKTTTVERSLDPTLRLDLLRVSEDTKYEGKGRNIFRAEAEVIPKAKFPAIKPMPAPPPVAQGPPPPPPINLKFYGFASRPGEPKKIFLSQGDDVFIAGEGEIVDRRYKVLQISPTSVEIEDVLTNNRQSIPLTQGQG